MQDTEIFPQSDRTSVLLRGQLAFGANHTGFAEYTESQSSTFYRISPLTVTNLNYPANGRFYPTAFATANGISGALRLNWRLSDAGGRSNDVDAVSRRLVIGSKGLVWGWDYDTALNYSTSSVSDQYVDGYVNTAIFDRNFLTGNINPFGPQDAQGQALINEAKIQDNARKSVGITKSFDVRASRPIFSMAAGDAALAIGAEARKESMQFDPSELLRQGLIRSEGTATQFRGEREVNAVFAELVLPLAKSLELQLAVRHDRYNDVGTTTNPKVGIRWNPLKTLLVRGSYATGFRAPSLADLYSPTRIGQTNGIYNDPLGCFGANNNNPDYCGIQPDKLRGGSVNLKPEESKQASLGFVWEPFRALSAQVDYWQITKSDTIASPEGVYFSDVNFYAPFITRAAPDPTLPGIPGRITQIDSRLRNLGELRTSGFDVGIDLRLPATSFGKFGFGIHSTYVLKYEVQDGPGRPYVSAVGRFANDQVIQRYRHIASFNYDLGAFSATLQQNFFRGHIDQNRNPDGSIRRVSDYQLWDLSTSYRGIKNLTIRAGVKNLADKSPPKSNQIYSFLAGYDPNYTDPRGRTFTMALAYQFK
jgi:iron complex outermembrane recepter protein